MTHPHRCPQHPDAFIVQTDKGTRPDRPGKVMHTIYQYCGVCGCRLHTIMKRHAVSETPPALLPESMPMSLGSKLLIVAVAVIVAALVGTAYHYGWFACW